MPAAIPGCYVLLQHMQILSLHVKTVIPKLFPLGQIKRLCPVTKAAWLAVRLSDYHNVGPVAKHITPSI